MDRVNDDYIKKPFSFIHEFTNKPRKGDVCGKKIKEGDYCMIHKPKKVDELFVSLKNGKYIHQQSKFVFFSKEIRVVYGKVSFYDTIIPLCDKDIEVCKKYKFKYDEKLFKQGA